MEEQELSIGLLKALALMQHLDQPYTIVNGIPYDKDGIAVLEYDEEDYSDAKYMVLTEEEAQKKAEENIKESLWAFNADFIIDHSKLPYEAKEMIQTFRQTKCESANDTIEALIVDMGQFIEDAIGADGRGHFMNNYDGHEHEEYVEGQAFYIYRMN